MKREITNLDRQRADFIDSLHTELQKQQESAFDHQKKFASLANSYKEDGLSQEEVVELLIIDGLSRESAQSYSQMAVEAGNTYNEQDGEFTFQFEDVTGRIWNSCELGLTVQASSHDEAWTKAEDVIAEDRFDNLEFGLEADKVISISRLG